MRRPWNIINVPVYSLATYSKDFVNMNICTYVTAISMKPKMYAIAIDPKSKTYENLIENSNCVLQSLNTSQIDYVKTLGKKSGKNFDKYEWLRKQNELKDWQGKAVLKSACAFVLLEKKEAISTGDHQLFIFKTLKFQTSIDTNLLMFQDLVDANIIL